MRYKPGKEFPYFLLGILATAIFASAVSLCGLFPYVGYMVLDLKLVDEIDKAGYFAGYITSSYMIGRMISSYYWGRIADTKGRRIVMLIGCASIIFMSIIFGFSSNFGLALLSRFFLGFLNPIVGIAKTLVSEICSTEHECSGMGIVTGCWNLGLIIGPGIGGILSRPAAQYPALFGNYAILQNFPYLLPNIVTAFIALLSFFFIYFFLPETLPEKTVVDEGHTAGFSSDSNPATGKTTSGLMTLIKSPSVNYAIGCYFIVSICSIIFDEVFTLWCIASSVHGGLNLSISDVGKIMSITGAVLVVFTFTIFSVMANKLGPRWCFFIGQIIACPVYFWTPFLHQFLYSKYLLLYICLAFIFAKISSSLAFASNAVIINQSVPTDHRASVNGLAMTVGSLAKALGPFSGSIIFAWSLENQLPFPFDYRLIFLITAVLVLSSNFIPAAYYTAPTPPGPIPMDAYSDTSLESSSGDISLTVDTVTAVNDDVEMTDLSWSDKLQQNRGGSQEDTLMLEKNGVEESSGVGGRLPEDVAAKHTDSSYKNMGIGIGVGSVLKSIWIGVAASTTSQPSYQTVKTSEY